MSQTYEFKMAMTCEGCAGAAKRVLGKLGDKVTNVETSVENQKVTVTSSLTSDELLAELQKTGKEVKFIGAV